MKTTRLLSLIFLLQLSSHTWAFIGGHDLTENISGIVKIFKDDNIADCSGTIVGPKHILTASHCLSISPSAILGLSPRTLVGPHVPFQSRIRVLTNSKLKTYKSMTMNVKDVHFYQAYAVKKLKLNRTPDINELLALGDVAILELSEKLPVTAFSQLSFGPAIKGDKLWMGGFGKRGPRFNHINVSEFNYQGSFAQLGKKQDAINFEAENLKNEITYIAPGDSGGGVFKLINNSYQLVGINHASFTKVMDFFYQIEQDPETGKILYRTNIPQLKMIGFIQYFNSENTLLSGWIRQTLQK